MNSPRTILLNEVAANGSSVAMNTANDRHIAVEICMTAFTGTVKLVGSQADVENPPAFGSAASVSNPWTYVKSIDLIDGSAVNGGTGKTGAATTAVYNLEVNTNIMKWIGAEVSGFAGGTVTVRAVSGDSERE
jgi:hypothetical protein